MKSFFTKFDYSVYVFLSSGLSCSKFYIVRKNAYEGICYSSYKILKDKRIYPMLPKMIRVLVLVVYGSSDNVELEKKSKRSFWRRKKYDL